MAPPKSQAWTTLAVDEPRIREVRLVSTLVQCPPPRNGCSLGAAASRIAPGAPCRLPKAGCPPPDSRQVVFRAEEVRAKPKAGRAGREPFGDIARTDAAHRKYSDIARQHGAQSLQVLWAVGRCGKQLKLLRAGANRVKRFGWRCYAGQHLQVELQATSDHVAVTVRHDGDAAAGLLCAAYVIRRQHGPRSDRPVGPSAGRKRRDARERIGGIEWHLDHADACVVQHVGYVDYPFWDHPTQDRNQGDPGRRFRSHVPVIPRDNERCTCKSPLSDAASPSTCEVS